MQQLASIDDTPSRTGPPAPGTDPRLLTPIQQLWMLSGRLPKGQEQVASCLCLFAKTQGMQIVQPLDSTSTNSSAGKSQGVAGVQAVADLLQFQDRLGRLIASLPNHEGVVVLKSTWEQVLNVELMAESLAKFLDQILRNAKRMDQYHGDFSKIISGLFVPLTAKDVFEAFYKKDLAKRLLWNRIVSMDVEKAVCSLFKAECGAAYTSKMEGMFQDVDWSRETMMLYKQSTGGEDGAMDLSAVSQVEMEVQVLTTGYWPVYPQYSFHLPQLLLSPQDRFEAFYKNKYQGRRIAWQYALGHCVVKANGLSRPYEFIVSLSQALVLVQFNDRNTWTLPELMKQIGIEDREEMERILQSLSVAKEGTRILRKLDFDAALQKKKKPRPSVDDKDQFEVFEQFESNQRRIRINNIMMKESKEEREKTVEAVSRDRLYLIDAVLVRIMKARKTLLHQDLIPQVLEQLKFPANSADVKKRIESLIEREYMERDAKDRNRYNYLA
jgi:cullin-4